MNAKKRLNPGKLLVVAFMIIVGAISSLAASGSANAAPLPASVSSVTVSGSSAAPTVTIQGVGFGAKPVGGVITGRIPGCGNGTFTGRDYPNGELWLLDTTVPWGAGYYSGPSSSNCVGLKIGVWTARKVVLHFGNSYGSFNWSLNNGDTLALSVNGAPGFTTVSGLS